MGSSEHAWIHSDAGHRSRLIEFNYHPAAWARVERLRAMCPMVTDFERLRANPNAERFLSRWILSEWRLAEPYIFHVEQTENRLGLVSAGALEQLAERLGLLCYAGAIRVCIRREDRAMLTQQLGEAGRQYALSGALRYGAEVKAAAPQIDVPLLSELTLPHVRANGWQMILSCMTGAPEAVARRFELKMPIGVELQPTDSPRSAWPLIERVLKSEFRGEWQACCC